MRERIACDDFESSDNSVMEKESFEAFKNSFSYGNRSDLNFKFFKALSEEDAGKFFQGLLTLVADAADDGDTGSLADYVIEWQTHGYNNVGSYSYDDGAFVPLKKPLAESRVALITSTGHFVDGDDPAPFGIEGMTHMQAQERIMDFLKEMPTFSHIPADTPNDQLRIVHGGYPVRSAENDPNVALPVDHMRNLEAERVIGSFAGSWSFSGACAQTPLIRKAGPQLVERLLSENIDAVMLVPV